LKFLDDSGYGNFPLVIEHGGGMMRLQGHQGQGQDQASQNSQFVHVIPQISIGLSVKIEINEIG